MIKIAAKNANELSSNCSDEGDDLVAARIDCLFFLVHPSYMY
jgi:hypothetical protein